MSEDKPVQWADRAQFHARPHDAYTPERGVEPDVRLLWMTPDPLGAMASMSLMYQGVVIKSLKDVTDEQRWQSLEDMQRTHLPAPLEAIKLQFILDGVDRAFTHQHVRQRTAVFAQESMRFAVVEDLPHNSTLPPALHGTEPLDDVDEGSLPADTKEQRWRGKWDRALQGIGSVYEELVADGMPAEEARGLLPHATATRINYTTDLRNLVAHSGNRLCTQAQFHWRDVFNQIVGQIRSFADDESVSPHNAWQFDAIADSNLFRPACYQLGHCPFQASFDRPCSIRDRVELFARNGVPSTVWNELSINDKGPILPGEWMLVPDAAREK